MADVETNSSESNLPAQIPYRTLCTFRDTLRADGLPQRIDKSMMRNMSGTVQNQLMHALRQLNLIDKNGIPQPKLDQWVNASGPERQQILKNILEEAYPTILGEESGGFKLSATTAGHLREKFSAFGGKPDTTRKAQTFFLHAAKDAALTISPRISIRQRTNPARAGVARKPSGNKGSGETPPRDTNGGVEKPPSDPKAPPLTLDISSVNPRYKLLLNMLEILPADGTWEDEEELENWLEAMAATLKVRTKVRRGTEE